MNPMVWVVVSLVCFPDGSCRGERHGLSTSIMDCPAMLREVPPPENDLAEMRGRACFRMIETPLEPKVAGEEPRPTRKPGKVL